MCGIFCLISSNDEQNNEKILVEKFKLFEDLISRRGPNALNNHVVHLKTCNILFAASVLWLQGAEITVQPVTDDDSVFVYNGDVFGGSLINNTLISGIGDTRLFFNFLKRDKICDVENNIEGPFAFIYLDKIRNKLFLARDMYGRRSLLIGKSENQFIITSVARRNTEFNFMELPCNGIFSVDLGTRKWQIFPWRRRNKNFTEKMRDLGNFLQQEIFMEQIELQEDNSFQFPSETQLNSLKMLSNLPAKDMLRYLCHSLYLDKIVKLKELIENSIKKRILTQPKFCQSCYGQYDCNHSTTGVLFSGGVDCAILALLSDKFIEKNNPIDLINVAFEKAGTYNTPDRVTGVETLKELQTLCPWREWNFVEVNVTREELDLCRSGRISDLIYPLQSILDDSLGCALWFASRGMAANYTSPCRARMGADELFGGYTRHRAAFQKTGWRGLHEVLEEDWQNLPHRNLARDDRVVSDHGRQLRTPYLDEQVVSFVQDLHCWEK